MPTIDMTRTNDFVFCFELVNCPFLYFDIYLLSCSIDFSVKNIIFGLSQSVSLVQTYFNYCQIIYSNVVGSQVLTTYILDIQNSL